MMIDRTRPANRGFATGINEFSGYTGVALATLLSGYLAARYGLRPVPFLPSLAFIALGVILTLGAVDETKRPQGWFASRPPLFDIGALPLLAVARNRVLLVCSQAGLVTNFLDSMVWGLLPLYLFAHGLRVEQIGVIVGVYPLAWGLGQAVSGPLSDRLGRRLLITLGLAGQGVAIGGFLVLTGFSNWLMVAIVVGLFRALAYPTLLAAAADSAREDWRASALGVYRFYRDSGFVLGGLAGGVVADLMGIPAAIALAAGLAVSSAAVAARFIGARLEARQAADVFVQAGRSAGG
jgi:MFS family permease